MRAEPERIWWLAVVAAVITGMALMCHAAWTSSATYDEVAYLRIAATWWRTGDQQEITWMGSPLTFWKLQQVPTLWVLDHLGHREFADDPMSHISTLLPIARIASLWIWLVALGLTAGWSRVLYGPKAMAFAAWLFTLSPNLLAHGGLITMEMPLVAASTGVFLAFWRFLDGKRRMAILVSAVAAGLAFSCKFTAILLPPMLGLVWLVDKIHSRRSLDHGTTAPTQIEPNSRPLTQERAASQESRPRSTYQIIVGMGGFVAIMLLADFVLTGFAISPLSTSFGGDHPSIDGRFGPSVGKLVSRIIESPLPQDWVGFSRQVMHQRSGGSSYLFGQRRMKGWWYYYFVALAVKSPLSLWLLLGIRALQSADPAQSHGAKDWVLPVWIVVFLLVTASGSSRNYGVRYLLPMSPLAIVWISRVTERGRLIRILAVAGLIGQAIAVASIHPYELTYFNRLAGGPLGGRKILSDSNLDWGQGLMSLARLQRSRPEFRDLTLYQFGDRAGVTLEESYGIIGKCYIIDAGREHPGLPATLQADTTYIAVSASLQWGPWGPDRYFKALDGLTPVAMTDDTTIAIYRTSDLPR